MFRRGLMRTCRNWASNSKFVSVARLLATLAFPKQVSKIRCATVGLVGVAPQGRILRFDDAAVYLTPCTRQGKQNTYASDRTMNKDAMEQRVATNQRRDAQINAKTLK